MAMFTAFYDASGTEETGRPLVLVGLVSTELKWRKFEREWREFLGLPSFDVPYLHMKEYAFSRGPFARWKNNEEKRAAFLREAIKVLKKRVHRVFESHVLPEDFRVVNEMYDLQTVPDHLYSVVGIAAVMRINMWMAKQHPASQIHHVFEAGDVGQGVFFRHVPKDLALSMSIRPKRDPVTGEWFPPFQAADLIAYEYRLALEQDLAGKSGRRAAFRELAVMVPTGSIYYDQEHLIALCQKFPELFPRRSSGAAST